MSADRELLELAAKAAGKWKDEFELNDDYEPIYDEEKGFRLAWGNGWWNPKADDGDAFRLAVKLNMIPSFGREFVSIGRVAVHNETDPYYAARRAIVHAAAAIEKDGGAA